MFGGRSEVPCEAVGARPLPGALVAGGLLLAGLFAAVIYFPVRIHGERAARAREHHGVVTIDFCEYHGRGNDSADCVGTFRSDDGALVVPDVRCTFVGAHQDMRRHATEPATLAGPDDTTASLDENAWLEPAVMWTLDAILLAWLIAQSVWFVRAVRRHRAGAEP